MMILLLIIALGYRDNRIGLFVVGGMGAVGLAVSIFNRPWLGVYILAVSIMTNMSDVLGEIGGVSINKPLVALTFVSVMASHLMNNRFFTLKRVEWFLVAYLAALLAATFVATDQDISMVHVLDFVKELMIIFIVVYAIESLDAWKRTMWLVVLSVTILAALQSYQVITGDFNQTFWGFARYKPDMGTMRLTGPIHDPNFWGQTLVAILPVAIYRLLGTQASSSATQKVVLIAAISVALLIFVIMNTLSRGAFLGMMLVFLLIAIEREVTVKNMMVYTASLMLIPLLLWSNLTPTLLQERLQTFSIFTDSEATLYEDRSFQGRTSEMRSALLMLADSPLFGIGAGNYEAAYQEYAARLGLEFRSEERAAHSLYLEIAAETGAFGLIAFLGALIWVHLGLFQVRRRAKSLHKYSEMATWSVSLQIGIAAYMTTSIFLHGAYLRFLWLLIGLAASLIRISQQWPENTSTDLSKEKLILDAR